MTLTRRRKSEREGRLGNWREHATVIFNGVPCKVLISLWNFFRFCSHEINMELFLMGRYETSDVLVRKNVSFGTSLAVTKSADIQGG